jgi:hypothetical protein
VEVEHEKMTVLLGGLAAVIPRYRSSRIGGDLQRDDPVVRILAKVNGAIFYVPFSIRHLQCDMRIHWGRIILGAFILEVVLFIILVPIGSIFGMTAFFVSVPIGCFLFGFLLGMWVVRNLKSGFVLHGALVGIIATILYLGLCAASPGSIPAAVAVYGLLLFVFSNALRIAGCMAGAFAQEQRKLRAAS